MPRDASGDFTLPTNDSSPASPRNVIRSSDFNELMTDISSGLTDSLSRSGDGGMQADLDMGGNDVLNAPNLLETGDIGVIVQAYSDNLAALAGVTPGAAGTSILASEAATDVRNVLDTASYLATRTALKALDTTKETTVFLTENGREGIFNWTTGDYSTEIAADTEEGIYLKADAIAATVGAWVRVYDGRLRPEWFGATGNAVKLTDAAITSSDNTLTSASASFTSSDVGKSIVVKGAGSGGNSLATTIASVNSGTSVELTAAASTTVSSAICIYGTDDASAWRKMISLGLTLSSGAFSGKSGAKYLFASSDPADSTSAHGLYVNSVSISLSFMMHGATIAGSDAVDTDGPDGDAGAIMRFICATSGGTASGLKFEWLGGTFDMSALTTATSGVTTVGGIALEGAWNFHFSGVVFDHGTTTASGTSIGVGGGDQSIFATGFESGLIENCYFRGAPDLGIYLSNSNGKRLKIIGNHFYRCQNCIDFKRSSGDSIVANNTALECDRFLGTPLADGSTTNQGRFLTISGNRLKKIQTMPIDINAPSDRTLIFGNVIEDMHRRISDGTTAIVFGSQKFGIRVRAHQCNIFGNWIGFVDWTADTTSGEQSMGVILAYDGNHLKGAEDCQIYGNTFAGTFRGVLANANTTDNHIWGNKRVSVSNNDSDGGSNLWAMPVANDGTSYGSSAGGSAIIRTNATERFRIDQSTGNVGINETSPDYKLDVNGTFGFTPGSSVTPVDNGDVVFQLTSNTQLTIKAKGSDGTVRSGNITLA